MHGMTRAQWYISDDLLERDTHLKREKRSRLTGSEHLWAIVLLYSGNLLERFSLCNYYCRDESIFARVFLLVPRASKERMSKSIETVGSPASIFATRD